MKKLGRLIINPEKVINNDELIRLKGGYIPGGTGYACYYQLYGTEICCRVADPQESCSSFQPSGTTHFWLDTDNKCDVDGKYELCTYY